MGKVVKRDVEGARTGSSSAGSSIVIRASEFFKGFLELALFVDEECVY